MNTLIKSGLAAALSLAIAAPAFAGDDQIVVNQPAAMKAWSKEVSRSLSLKLLAAEKNTRITPRSSIVQLRFTLDEDGRAHEFETYRSSGDRGTDIVAQRAVRSLRGLDRVPVADAGSRKFQANIVFARNDDEFSDLVGELRDSERQRMARGDTSVVVVGS